MKNFILLIFLNKDRIDKVNGINLDSNTRYCNYYEM